jgi:hypothetical membrane protein
MRYILRQSNGETYLHPSSSQVISLHADQAMVLMLSGDDVSPLDFSAPLRYSLRVIHVIKNCKLVKHNNVKEKNATMATAVKDPPKGMDEQPAALKRWLSCGIIGPLLFIVVFLIEGATRADYNPFRYPVSSLSIGAFGWIQAANFLMVGSLLIAFSLAVRRVLGVSRGVAWEPLLIGLSGVGLFGAGIFTTDPVYGYPPDAPLVLAQYSVHGHLHDFFSILLFVGLPIACFVFCRRFATVGERGWAVYSCLSGLAMLLTFVLAGMGFTQNPSLVHFAGVFQRLSISIGLTWIALLAFRLMIKKPPLKR